jgi:predicted glycoside hydrolase/deacetylase ChbG (UPF0249 family)
MAHRDGILTAASLMVGAPAAADAVLRARRMPGLRVGLHLVLVEGRPLLPPRSVPNLVDKTGHFRTDMVRFGIDIFARPALRRQIGAEIEAQFHAFRATGLALDHVNAHKHFHVHPSVASEIIAIGARYGVCGLRVPIEPGAVLAKVERRPRQAAAAQASAAQASAAQASAAQASAAQALAAMVAPWAKLLARRARRAGLRSPDAVFGLAWSGAMTPARLTGLIQNLPPGCTEIYLHPATRGGFEGHAAGYRYAEELAALLAPSAIAAARSADIKLGGYADIGLR